MLGIVLTIAFSVQVSDGESGGVYEYGQCLACGGDTTNGQSLFLFCRIADLFYCLKILGFYYKN